MTFIHKIFIADDEALFRNAIELIINSEEDMEVIGTAENGLEAIEKIEQLQPHIVLLDIQMPVMNGIECTRRIREQFPDMHILILTTFNEEDYIIEGLAYGANGYILKGIDFKKLIQTIRDAMKGQYLLPTEVAGKLAKYLLNNKSSSHDYELPSFIKTDSNFTSREKEVIHLLLNRLSNKEIGDKLFVTEGTVKNHLTIIYDKLSVKSRHDAIQYLKKG